MSGALQATGTTEARPLSARPTPDPGWRRSGRLAFVLAGGGSGGAYQVGALRALTEAGIVPDLVVGTSAGALNAVAFAADPTLGGVDRLGQAWAAVRREDIFPLRPGALWAAARHSDHLVSDEGLRRWIESYLPVGALEQTRVPVHVVATDLESGMPVVISEGRAVPALLASSAIPGLLPPVRLGGLRLVDGGVAADTPVRQAVELGATEVVLLSAFQPGGLGPVPTNPINLLWYAYEQVFAHWSMDQVMSTSEVTVFSVPLPARDGRGPLDFSAGHRRMEDAYLATRKWLRLDAVMAPPRLITI